MYGILLVGSQAPPELVTAARSREDFLAALRMRNTRCNWRRAVCHFRVACEVSDFRDARSALDAVRRDCPQHYLDCRFLLGGFLAHPV
jgi:hypothetical protein